MLKRNQVLLSDWLIELLKHFAKKYDLSFSETIRLMLCMQLESLVSIEHPKYKFDVRLKEVLQILKEAEKRKSLETAHHKLISKIYFEARKAAEYILDQEKKAKE